MQTIDLECPSCGEMLELDSGFAGGVCRCSNCGTLMTVPSDAGQAETLSRPGENQSFDSDADLGAMSGSVPSRTSTSRGKKGKGKTSERIEPGEYLTASGKVVKLDNTVRVPMAESKKKQIRAVTAIVFFSIVMLGVIAGVVAIILITGGGKDGGDGTGEDQIVQFDPTANPYDLPFANIAGLPLEGKTAIVVEGSEASYDWMLEAGEMVAIGLSKPGTGVSAGLFPGAPSGPKAIDITSLSSLDGKAIKDWFENMPVEGEPDVAAGIKSALNGAPDMMILIVTKAGQAEIEAWSSLIESSPNLTIHAVLINGVPSDLRDWLSGREGSELVLLSPQDIRNFGFMSETYDR